MFDTALWHKSRDGSGLFFEGLFYGPGCDTGQNFLLRDLVQKRPKERRGTNLAPCYSNSFDTQRSFIDRYVDFTPGLAVCSAMFVRVLFHLFGSLDPGTVDQKMQRAIAAISNINSQSFLPIAQGAEIRNRPSQASQARQVFNKTVGLS